MYFSRGEACCQFEVTWFQPEYYEMFFGHDLAAWSFQDSWQEQTNGWQAVDSTPQELSNGKFQMGPASVKEVQRGESDCYDTDFVIGEVNGDIKLFVPWRIAGFISGSFLFLSKLTHLHTFYAHEVPERVFIEVFRREEFDIL